MDNQTDSIENLIEHKQIIKAIIGRLNRTEHEKSKKEEELRNLREDMKTLLFFQPEKILRDKETLEKLKDVNSEEIIDYYKKQIDVSFMLMIMENLGWKNDC